jgi:hypothetical protein
MARPRRSEPAYGAETILLSDKVIGSVVAAWKVGKADLALLVVGTIAMLAAFTLAMSGRNEYVTTGFMVAGFALVAFVTYKLYVDAVKPASRASRQIEQNSELMNAVQEATLQLTSIISKLNDYALFHADDIVTAIKQAKEALTQVPSGSKVLNLDSLKTPEEFANSIRLVAERWSQVVADIRDSVAKSDATRIVAHLDDLKRLRILIENELFPKRA